MQGIDLIFDNTGRSTWQYGILTIAVIWIPGFVAAIHIMSMYRHHYTASKTICAVGESFTHQQQIIFSKLLVDLSIAPSWLYDVFSFFSCDNIFLSCSTTHGLCATIMETARCIHRIKEQVVFSRQIKSSMHWPMLFLRADYKAFL